jgi:hypothetical protein
MRSVADVVRERAPLLTGSEVLYSAIADLVESGATALRAHPACGVCEYASCTRPSTADSPFCKKHQVAR